MNMKQVTKDTKVTFALDKCVVGAREDKQTFSLDDIGWNGEQGNELNRFLTSCFDEWLSNHIDCGWYFEDDVEGDE